MRSSFCIQCIPPGVWAMCVIGLLVSAWGGSKWGGSKLVHKPIVTPVTVKPGRFTVFFYAYDTKGKPLPGALLTGPASILSSDEQGHKQPEPFGDRLEQTQYEGQVLDVQFSYKGKSIQQRVVWKSGPNTDFDAWMKRDLLLKLPQLDPKYNDTEWKSIIKNLYSKTDANKCHFPIVFFVQ